MRFYIFHGFAPDDSTDTMVAALVSGLHNGNVAQSSTASILHVDMDAFFAAVEVRENPKLVGLPVLVGGSGERGVVAAASYEARIRGVHSAMPATMARRLCPDAVFLPGRRELYSQVSQEIRAIFETYTQTIEPLALDEAFLDVSGSSLLHGSPEQIATRIRDSVYESQRLWCSIGVAASKSVAKLACEDAKPKVVGGAVVPGLGVKVVPKNEETAFLRPLPIRALWGVGPKTAEKLHALGLETVGDIADLGLASLCRVVGSAHGRQLYQLSRGQDERKVESEQQVKSISNERTFEHDVTDSAVIRRELARLADMVASRLRSADVRARTVTIKVRFGSFETITRSRTMDSPISTGFDVLDAALKLMSSVDSSPGIRLLGIGLTSLTEQAFEQLTLGADTTEASRREEMSNVVDQVRRRFGSDAIGPATLLGDEQQTTWVED